MSAISEPFDESYSFPEALRGATFISMEGRAFRLFPEEEIPSSQADSDLLRFPEREVEKINETETPPQNETVAKTQTFQWPEHLAALLAAAGPQIRALADRLEAQRRKDRKIFSFNSLYSGEGCTTLTLCAARELSERGYHVLLADAHRQFPELPERLQLSVDPELYEILTLIPQRLELLPWAETFLCFGSSGREKSFGELVVRLRPEYDFILLDNGSLFETPVARRVPVWCQMEIDGILLVRNPKRSSLENLRAVAECLRQHEIELIGVAENGI